MSDVSIGEGIYDGKGVYANRDFEVGEIVVPYNLTKLNQTELDGLPESELQWTHSFWGEVYLFPEPGRYVNHSEDPSTYPDLTLMADVAIRDIKKGEPITIYNPTEWLHELTTFLEAYGKANDTLDFDNIAPFIDDEAVFEFTNGTFEGIDAVRNEFKATWDKIREEEYSVTDLEWTTLEYDTAIRTYRFKSDGIVNGKRQVYKGSGRTVFKRIRGNWQIVHEKLIKDS